ncbi:hypothetical protein J4477_00755 [Candidatus Pacearchaeota archaeon]|nr:hypothetical protein [Candidatus Pacearchaeota archaeon]
MVIIRDESLVKKAIDFASNALDADEIFQLTHISLSGRKAVEKRIEEIKGNNFYYCYLFDVPNIHPDDREKYIRILAYLAF